MASTYTPLGVELQSTGENAGTWGTKTNTNLSIIEQIAGGYTAQAVADSGDTTLTVNDGSTGATLSHRIIEFTGSLTASRNVTIPLDVQNFYILKNATSGSQNVVFKYATGTGTSATVANGKTVIAYAKADDGSNPNITMQQFGLGDVVDDTTPQLGGNLDMNGQDIVTTSNADLELAPNGTGHVTVKGNDNQGAIQFNCENNSHGQQIKAAPHSESASNILTIPSSGGNSTLVSLASTATLTNKTLTAPKIVDAGFIADANGNEQIIFQTTASAVNELEVTNAATGNNPGLAASGGDTNVGIEFTAKGAGYIKFNDLAYIPQQALTSSSNAVAWDVQAKPNAYHLTTENTTFAAPTNSVEGSFICLEINYNGSHTIAFNTVFEFAASTAPTFTSADGKADILVFKYNGAVWQEVGRTLNLSES